MRTLSSLKIAADANAPRWRTASPTAGLQRLKDYQHDDGGFGWWKTDDNHPFMTAYALYGYLEARRAGLLDDDVQAAAGRGVRRRVQYREYPRMVPDLKVVPGVRAGARRGRVHRGRAGMASAWDGAAVREELWNGP